jgi:hypothetical protein
MNSPIAATTLEAREARSGRPLTGVTVKACLKTLRRHLLERRPTPVSVVWWVVTGRWPAPNVHIDVAVVAPETAPLI